MSAAIDPTLASLWKRGTEFLGCPLAIMGGAMSWVSEHTLVAALSNAGAFGVLAASSMPPELLDKEIAATKAATQKPFGVNLIIMHPQLEQLVAVCAKHRITHVVLAGGMPKQATIDALHAFGAKVIGFAPAGGIGRKLVKMGIDALVIEGTEAGGHIGPVSTSVLAQEILPLIKEVPIFVAGGIGRGQAMAAYLQMGASGVQLGTRFVCAEESIAHANFKQAFIRASARNAHAQRAIRSRFHGDSGARGREQSHRRFHAFPERNRGKIPRGRTGQARRAARHRTFLGGQPAPRGDRRGCGARLAHGRPERGHGRTHRTRRCHSCRTD